MLVTMRKGTPLVPSTADNEAMFRGRIQGEQPEDEQHRRAQGTSRREHERPQQIELLLGSE